MRIKFYPAFFAAAFLLLWAKSFSQSGTYGNSILTEKPDTPIDSIMNGFIEVLPLEYASNPGKKYPLLIFFEGINQLGNGNSELSNLWGAQNVNMLPDIIKQGKLPGDVVGDNSFTVGITTYHFIIIIPQVRPQIKATTTDWVLTPDQVNDAVDYALQNYRVDEDRIYLSGLSLGGGAVINYPGQSANYGGRIAALASFSPASNLWDNHSRVTNIAQANLPLWIFEVTEDLPYDTLGQRYIDSLVTHQPSYSAEALITHYPAGGHNSWEPALESPVNSGNVTYPNVYYWLLSKTRSLSPPVFATLDAGPDQTLNLASGSMIAGINSVTFTGAQVTLNAITATAAPGRTITTQWVKVDGIGGTITSPTSLSTTITDLKPGSYTFQLRATDDQGLVTIDNVKVQVNAPPENKYKKIQASEFSQTNPGGDYQHPMLNNTILDQGPSYGLNYMNNGHWAEYDLSSLGLSPGTYSLYIRYSSPFGDPGVRITVDNTTIYNSNLTSVPYYPNPPSWYTSNQVAISLGSNSTIRIESLGDQWDFNYFELALTSPLPVNFVYFNSQCKDGSAHLQWKTADEQNTNRFSIQRSTDGTSWREVGSVAATGQTTQERSYSFTDGTASTSANLYRIVEYDYTGQQIMSTIVRSNCSLDGTSVSLYPNPSPGISALNITLQQGSRVNIQVLDSRGSVLQQKGILLPAGNSSIPLNLSNYADGVYTIIMQYNGERKLLKLIKN